MSTLGQQAAQQLRRRHVEGDQRGTQRRRRRHGGRRHRKVRRDALQDARLNAAQRVCADAGWTVRLSSRSDVNAIHLHLCTASCSNGSLPE